MGAVLAAQQAAVIVVNTELRVQVWNSVAEQLWGLRSDEVVGTHFLDLDIGLEVERLRQPIRATLTGASKNYETSMNATNRRGKRIECRVTCSPLESNGTVRGAILHIEQLPQSGASAGG
jgi:two-component system CheB/CheR fusion protein